MQETVTLGSATHVGLVRQKNEDSHAIVQNGPGYPCALILADGMGGHRRGELASQVAVDYVKGQLARLIRETVPLQPDDIQSELTRIVGKANIKVYLSSLSDDENQGMGTTLTVAVLYPGHLLLAHVGDCRAYLLHDQVLKRLTVDHTLVQELVAAGSISPEESRQHPKRNVLTRALGIPDYLHPDLCECNLSSGDRLLLCSDGLHGLLADEEIREHMLKEETPDLLAVRLIDQALALGGEDNITVLTAFF